MHKLQIDLAIQTSSHKGIDIPQRSVHRNVLRCKRKMIPPPPTSPAVYALSILYPDNGVCPSVCHGSDVTSHLHGPYQCVHCERYSDVATLWACSAATLYTLGNMSCIVTTSMHLYLAQSLLWKLHKQLHVFPADCGLTTTWSLTSPNSPSSWSMAVWYPLSLAG